MAIYPNSNDFPLETAFHSIYSLGKCKDESGRAGGFRFFGGNMLF
jgi:hypothetical protein